MDYIESESLVRNFFKGVDVPAAQLSTVALLYTQFAEQDGDKRPILSSLMTAFNCGMGQGIAMTQPPINPAEELETLLKGE